jgi:CheY-like chemotaxis protein
VKFTASGEVRLALQTRRRDGRVQLVFQVSDTGIGIASDQIGSLFHRFAQADGSISRRFGGTGLGLAISKRLVEAMDGGIEVWSELGQGATFEVRLSLPVADALLAAEAPPTASYAADTGPLPVLRVLVAEDVPVNQELVRLMLAPLGCEVVVVGDGEQAVDAAASGMFDLILMDMQMPVLDGLEATRMIRRLGGEAARTPIVALTANVLPEQIERCLRAGMNDHVGKPFVTEHLQSMVLKWADGGDAAPPPVAPNPVLDDLTAQIGAGTVRGLLTSLDAQMAQILATPVDTDPAALSHLAHSLRGAAGALGYGDAARACQAVETAHGAGASADAAFTSLQSACCAARAALEQRLVA